MSRRSGIATLAVTVTVTVFAAAMVFVTDPRRDEDYYSAQVLEEAKRRQNSSITSVPEPLKGKEALREEDIMAEKVSVILLDDDNFRNDLGSHAQDYVEANFSDIEEMYAQDTFSRIQSAQEASERYTDESVARLEAQTGKELKGLSDSIKSLQGEVNSFKTQIKAETEEDFNTLSSSIEALEKEVESLKAQLEAQNTEKEVERLSSSVLSLQSEVEDLRAQLEAVDTKESILAYILSDSDFMKKLSDEVSLRIGKNVTAEELKKAVLESAELNAAITDAVEAYYSKTTSEDASLSEVTTNLSIPVPEFKSSPVVEYSEEEYLEKRNEVRDMEIDKILSFLGYN